MQSLYSLSMYLFGAFLRIGARFNAKAKLWTEGRRDLFARIRSDLETISPERRSRTAWFHCASLGEFEQGRPLMERIRELYPQSVILLTFFSPSGYEIRKNTPVADFIWYLPLDTPGNARRFVSLVRPAISFFVKYEYWFNLLKELKKADIPVFLVSAVFRNQQLFFQWYGKWFLKQLHHVTWFFLQNGDAKSLLEQHGIRNFTVTGDTRFDRVSAIVSDPKEFPLVEKFCAEGNVLVAGSTWPEDEALILPLIVNRKIGLKYIIAPHEVHETRIALLVRAIRETSGMPVGRHAIVQLSQLTKGNASKAKVLVVDSIGQLAHLYRYATFAFVGGGFGTGLHNILEPVSFGKPVIFGPVFDKFPEAAGLVRLGGAASVKNPEEAKALVKRLLTDAVHRQHMSDICRIYAESNKGATRRILDCIRNFGFMPGAFNRQGEQISG
jgi:3-deoxy-D-manno-octulosonic-acid transferase